MSLLRYASRYSDSPNVRCFDLAMRNHGTFFVAGEDAAQSPTAAGDRLVTGFIAGRTGVVCCRVQSNKKNSQFI